MLSLSLPSVFRRSPFLVHAFYAFQDEHQVYLVMDFQAGGDLHFLLHSRKFVTRDGKSHIKPLPEAWVKFYMAEILLGLEELHSAGIVNRSVGQQHGGSIWSASSDAVLCWLFSFTVI